MKLYRTIADIRALVAQKRNEKCQIALVPTMGALHPGHFQLIEQALRENDIVVASIFINPTQFNEPEDLEKYPSDLNADIEALERLGCHAVFAPDSSDMYPKANLLKFNTSYFDSTMEGKYRPGHLSGVAQVVSKLFNITKPHKAYFGQKDLQQLVLIKTMVSELNFDIDIIGVPTVREANGLAMSSRNERLSEREKETAANMYKGLRLTVRNLRRGRSVEESLNITKHFFKQTQGFELEYLEVVDAASLKQLDTYSDAKDDIAICAAGYVGGVRLLDNICIPPKELSLSEYQNLL